MLQLQKQDSQDPLLHPRALRVRLREGGVREGEGARHRALRRHRPLLQAPVQGRLFLHQNRDRVAAAATADRQVQADPVPISVPVPLPIPAAGVSVQLPYAAAATAMPPASAGMPAPTGLLSGASAAVPPVLAGTIPRASAGLSAPTGMLSGASAAVPVPALDAVPVPRLEAGLLLRGCATRRPLRCHVMLLRARWRPGGLLAAT